MQEQVRGSRGDAVGSAIQRVILMQQDEGRQNRPGWALHCAVEHVRGLARACSGCRLRHLPCWERLLQEGVVTCRRAASVHWLHGLRQH